VLDVPSHDPQDRQEETCEWEARGCRDRRLTSRCKERTDDPPWNALSGAIDGHVHLRGSLAYEPLAPALNARFDHRQPEAIVRGASPEDVAETIRFVTRHRLEHATRFVPRPATTIVRITGACDLRGWVRAVAGPLVGSNAPRCHSGSS
jgi:hypothetical protein